jgi:ABC-type transport system involved in multi-copper enzyme maturation permease subunit
MNAINRTLARLTVRQTLRSRKLLVACLVALIPVAVGLVMILNDGEKLSAAQHGFGSSDPFDPLFLDLTGYLIIGGTVPFIAILLSGGVVADEIEDRTLSYVLMRPIKRRVLWMSRLVPLAIITAVLGAAQVFVFWLLRVLSLAMHGQGDPSTYYVHGVAHVMGDGQVLLLQLPGALLAVILASVAFVAMFSFVTLLANRFHFLANLGIAALVEFTFGNVGGRGLGAITVTFHARSLMHAMDPLHGVGISAAAPWYVAIPMLGLLAAGWTWVATWRVQRQDFNITSAAS